ncbi:GGDEF domain-containing protein [Streptomyces lavendulae subsp. lavendulae]|uniref:GGDEF domain-containing protein n=1 Tax=Streptomyces lavendulae TaxID=1914 RepID=UPI00249FF69C|nr:GGDEF domain-containing protein [Streptomyces lavendulae]GLV86576.1 GGDEF domain-containing protein [Streptomyces lavendulae subsp. lavendulae]
MSQTLTALSAALPIAAGWSLHSLRLRRRIEAARRDPLTGLWTRDPFEERARKGLSQKCQRAVLVLDLNRFKEINDTLGHAAGDAVIQATGHRLGRWAEEHGGVAGRLGGDEFAATIPGYGIDKLRADLFTLAGQLDQPVPFDGHPIEVHTSIGAAYYCTGTGDLSTLLRRADEQMYKAKQRGGGWRIAHRLTVPETATVNGRREGRPGTSGEAA